MKVDLFDFDLPEKYIAKTQLKNRSDAKLLLVPELINKSVADLPDILPKNSLIIFNNTRVIPARLFGTFKDKKFEVMLHKNISIDTWLAFIKNSKKLKTGDVLNFSNNLRIKRKYYPEPLIYNYFCIFAPIKIIFNIKFNLLYERRNSNGGCANCSENINQSCFLR